MMLTEVTNVPDVALPIEAFKAHLRLGSGFGQDDVQEPVLVGFLRAAMVAIEARTDRILLVRSFDWSATRWRNPCGQVLPVAPVVGITQVTLIGPDGGQSPVPTESYWLDNDLQTPELRPVSTSLPGIPAGGRVSVRFDAGYGAVWGDLPADLQQAVLMLAAHYYEYRQDTGLSGGCMPFGVSSLIERYRPLRLSLGVRA